MADACTLSKEGLLDCGCSRDRTERVFLYEFGDDVTTHLKVVFCRVQTWKNTRSSITCLFSPSLWLKQVLEAFKAVSVSRAQRTTNQRQKSWRDSTLLWPRRCFSCLIYLCRQAHVRIKHTTFGGSLCLSLAIKLKLLLLLTEKIKWTYNECCVLS